MIFVITDKPDPPVGTPIASNISRESVTLSWTGSSYDGGSRIIGYVVEMRTVDDEAWTKADVVSHTSHTIDNLKPETKYLFRVSSENEHGISKPGQESDPILTVVEEKKKVDMRKPVTESKDYHHNSTLCMVHYVTVMLLEMLLPLSTDIHFRKY